MIIIIVVVAFLLLAGIGFAFYMMDMNKRIKNLKTMTSQEMIEFNLSERENDKIVIGIIQDGKVSYEFYGKDGKKEEENLREFEIGSLTKTFTTSLLAKAVSEGKIELDATIDKYLELPKQEHYPTILELATHTSGYKGYYMEKQMVTNFFHREKNDFYGITRETLCKRIGKVKLKDKEYGFKYSNFGLSVLGEILCKVYEKDYRELMTDYVKNELGMENTRVSDGTGKVEGLWHWQEEDAYLPAGSILSNIEDMTAYLQLQMEESLSYLSLAHEKQKELDANQWPMDEMGIRIDAAGLGWLIDEERGLLWHNGGTSNYNSYMAFDEEGKLGIVILSNQSPNYRISETVVGIRRMEELKSQTYEEKFGKHNREDRLHVSA